MKIVRAALLLAVFSCGIAVGRTDDALMSAMQSIAGTLNGAVNAIFTASKVPNHEATRVVPMVGGQSGGYLGMAQVTGSLNDVNATKAVVVVTASGNAGQPWSISAFVPVRILPVHGTLQREYGVGVAAVINAH